MPPDQLVFAAPTKLAKLPEDATVHKRPLNRPAITACRAGAASPKIVYVSSSAPFIAVVKRTRKYLTEIDKRSMSVKLADTDATLTDAERMAAMGTVEGRGEPVIVKATGRAIEKALRVALHFQAQEDCVVRITTGSVGTVDDIETETTSTRVRRTSVVAVEVSLR